MRPTYGISFYTILSTMIPNNPSQIGLNLHNPRPQIPEPPTPSQDHPPPKLIRQYPDHLPHPILPKHQRIPHRPAHKHTIGPQGNRLQHVISSSDPTIDIHLKLLPHLAPYPGQYLDGRWHAVQLTAAMIAHPYGVTEVGRYFGVRMVHYALEDYF